MPWNVNPMLQMQPLGQGVYLGWPLLVDGPWLEGGVTVIDEHAATMTAGQGHFDSQCFKHTLDRASSLHAFLSLTLHRGKWPIHQDKHNSGLFWHRKAFCYFLKSHFSFDRSLINQVFT